MKLLPPMLVLLVTLADAAACGKKNSSGPVVSPASAPNAASDVHAGALLPAACGEYQRQVLRCIESDHFPKALKEAQRSALEQMLSLAKQELSRTSDPGAIKEVADNCRDSLVTLAESSRQSCPGLF